MNKILVAVVDSSRARFLTLELADFPEERRGARLVELDGLLNPASATSGEDLWSSTKTGRNRGSGGQAHSYDDHRDEHRAEFERRFAQTIASHIANLIHTDRIQQLILVAESQIIGFMRDAIDPSVLHLPIKELAKNLCSLKPHELHKYLATQGLMPEPVRL